MHGMSFHAFGVVSNPDDFNSVIFDSAIAAATNPLKPGESGSTTFIAGAPGTYYYICTVPGHALQGMHWHIHRRVILIQYLALASLVVLYSLMFVGGYISASGLGLTCPEWPQCPNGLMPS